MKYWNRERERWRGAAFVKDKGQLFALPATPETLVQLALSQLGLLSVSCLECHARLVPHRTSTPQIDECGFESYFIECGKCKYLLAAIIDPSDDAVLISRSSNQKWYAPTTYDRLARSPSTAS
jgi:hypothetical protein